MQLFWVPPPKLLRPYLIRGQACTPLAGPFRAQAQINLLYMNVIQKLNQIVLCTTKFNERLAMLNMQMLRYNNLARVMGGNSDVFGNMLNIVCLRVSGPSLVKSAVRNKFSNVRPHFRANGARVRSSAACLPSIVQLPS